MPLLQFDPPNESSNSQQGGVTMDPETRKEFISLCKQVHLPHADLKGIVDRLIQLLIQNVTEYSISITEEKGPNTFTDDLRTFYSTIDPEETNYIGIYNTFCFQIVIMMFMYQYRDLSYNDYKHKMYSIKADSKGKWKNNRHFYGRLLNHERMRKLIHGENGMIYLGFPGFIRLGELNESYLNNVFYIGINYKTEDVDGEPMDPYTFFGHDMDHAMSFQDDSSPFVSELELYRKLREFVAKQKPSHLYSIDLILFCIIHETSIRQYKERTNNDSTYSVEVMMPFLTASYILPGFYEMSAFGSAIPKAYRIPSEENSNLLDESAVAEYIQLCIQRFSDALKEMRGNVEGGRYRKARKDTRRKGTGRKGRGRTRTVRK